MTRSEFEEKNRRLLVGDGFLHETDVFAWEDGRDWLAHRAIMIKEGSRKRRSPRLPISLSAYVAGLGRAVTNDIGFWGMCLKLDREAVISTGEETSVRLKMAGRSIYVLGRVVWSAGGKLGMTVRAAHPSDERALQAMVCDGLLDHWDR